MWKVIILIASAVPTGAFAFPVNHGESSFKRQKPSCEIDQPVIPRSTFFENVAIVSTLLLLNPDSSNAVASYSANARNMERINSGDLSGGSVYDNNPSTNNARRRRAMTGCKIPSARAEAASIANFKNLGEKECNMRVIDESPEFMLQAMRNLNCPTCPYGVNPNRE